MSDIEIIKHLAAEDFNIYTHAQVLVPNISIKQLIFNIQKK